MTYFRTERTDFRPDREDFSPERIDFRPDRADFRPGGTDGQTDKRMNERTNESPPVFYRTSSPLGLLPKK